MKKKYKFSPAYLKSKYQTGGSIVDYLKSQGEDSSKTARRQLAISRGFKGDLSAEDNLALLADLQNSKTATAQTTPPVNVMTPVQDTDPNTGQPMEMMVPTPQIMSMVRPQATLPVSSMIRPIQSARRTSAVKSAKTLNSDNAVFAKDATNRLAMYASTNQGTSDMFKRPSWAKPIRSMRPSNPVANLVQDSDYKTQVMSGKLKGRALGQLRSEGKITDREYNQLYSVLRSNGSALKD